MLTDYGIRNGAEQNSCHIYFAEDFAGRKGPIIHLSNVWTFLACCDYFGKHFSCLFLYGYVDNNLQFFFVCDENAITCTLIILFEITLFTNRLFMTVIILHQTPSVIQKTWNNFIYHAFDLKKFIITFFFDSNCLFYEYKQIAG